MNNFDLCRRNLHRRLRIDSLEKRESTEVQAEISRMIKALTVLVSLAQPRLIMGGLRYHSKWNHEDLMSYISKKFSLYQETGNMEMLVDMVNLLAIETSLKTHPKFHFKGEDRGA